jgi:dihydropteroate synthase
MTVNRWLRKNGEHPFLMGILNVTPDSFSDGGRYLSRAEAVKRAFGLADEGADILDIGGESTRPGSDPVSSREEIERIIPVLKEIAPSLGIPISVDTSKPDVADAALRAGANILNDVCGLSDPKMIMLAIDNDVPAIIMHMHGTPKTMAVDLMEGDAKEQIRTYLEIRGDEVLEAGMRKENIILDPGIGFGKTPQQDMDILLDPGYFSDKYPVLIGPSRKRFLSFGFPELGKDEATVAASLTASKNGADIIRVHNVAEVNKALDNIRIR